MYMYIIVNICQIRDQTNIVRYLIQWYKYSKYHFKLCIIIVNGPALLNILDIHLNGTGVLWYRSSYPRAKDIPAFNIIIFDYFLYALFLIICDCSRN